MNTWLLKNDFYWETNPLPKWILGLLCDLKWIHQKTFCHKCQRLFKGKTIRCRWWHDLSLLRTWIQTKVWLSKINWIVSYYSGWTGHWVAVDKLLQRQTNFKATDDCRLFVFYSKERTLRKNNGGKQFSSASPAGHTTMSYFLSFIICSHNTAAAWHLAGVDGTVR